MSRARFEPNTSPECCHYTDLLCVPVSLSHYCRLECEPCSVADRYQCYISAFKCRDRRAAHFSLRSNPLLYWNGSSSLLCLSLFLRHSHLTVSTVCYLTLFFILYLSSYSPKYSLFRLLYSHSTFVWPPFFENPLS